MEITVERMLIEQVNSPNYNNAFQWKPIRLRVHYHRVISPILFEIIFTAVIFVGTFHSHLFRYGYFLFDEALSSMSSSTNENKP